MLGVDGEARRVGNHQLPIDIDVAAIGARRRRVQRDQLIGGTAAAALLQLGIDVDVAARQDTTDRPVGAEVDVTAIGGDVGCKHDGTGACQRAAIVAGVEVDRQRATGRADRRADINAVGRLQGERGGAGARHLNGRDKPNVESTTIGKAGGLNHHVGAGVQCGIDGVGRDIGRAGAGDRRRAAAGAARRATGGARCDLNHRRIEQPLTARPLRGRGINGGTRRVQGRARGFDLAAMAAGRTALGNQRSGHGGDGRGICQVRDNGDRAAIAVPGGTRIDRCTLIDRGGGRRRLCAAGRPNRHAAAARFTLCGNLGPGVHRDGLTTDRHRAAIRIARIRGNDAGNLNNTGIATQQGDGAAIVGNAIGLDHTGVVDHRLQHRIGSRCAQDHLTRRSLDRTTIGDSRVHRRLADLEAHHAVAGQRHIHSAARTQCDRAFRRLDRAAIRDLIADHRDNTVARRRNRALVDDTGRAGTTEMILTGQEALIRDIKRGGHDAPDVHRCTGGEQHPAWVHQEDRAVRRQRAIDRAGITA